MVGSLLATLIIAPAQTELTFVRHGETVANATGKYNAQTLNAMSPKGEQQIRTLTAQLLKKKPFDIILVSPSARALKTVAPYMKAMHSRALVWPLLYECCTMKRPKDAHATKFTYGSGFQIPSIIQPYFMVDTQQTKLPVAPDYNSGLAQVAETVRVFKQKYAGKRVLIVGHSGHGGQFLKALTGKAFHVENAKIMEFRF